MQAFALTVDKFLDHAAKWSGDREIVTAEVGQAARRIGYAALREREATACPARCCASGFASAIASARSAWNTQHHLEMYYAPMGAGLVCHTLNPRLTVAHLAAMINEAEDRALAVASSLCAAARRAGAAVSDASSTSS